MIKLSIEVAEAAELRSDILEIAALINAPKKEETPPKKTTKKAPEQKKEVTEEVAEAEVSEEVVEVADEPEAALEPISVEDMRALVIKLSGQDSKYKEKAKSLLSELGYKALSDIPEENRYAFVERLEAI